MIVDQLPLPIVLAPLAGGPSTPRLVAEASEADAFGFLAADADRFGFGERAFAAEQCDQLGLAVAGDAGEPDDLAAAHVKRDVLELHAIFVAGGGGEPAYLEHGLVARHRGGDMHLG